MRAGNRGWAVAGRQEPLLVMRMTCFGGGLERVAVWLTFKVLGTGSDASME